jgi:trehalose-6-phosphate hydrolase
MNKILIAVLALMISPSCRANGDSTIKKWWKESVFYEIYMPSYADSDGDGYSDFKGMTGKLGYLESLGIKAVWLTPFLQSPKVDNGYDVASYYDIDATYGTLEDFKKYLGVAHRKGIKVIMDLVLNHTSTDSKWFREAQKSISNPYRDYYIWKDKPNNWESFFGGTAWEKDILTDQYYYHKFDKRMADLNWSNPKVVEEMQAVLRYWLNLGVDGFRLDVINFLTTDGITADNPMKDGVQEHLGDINQPGVKNAMRKIKSVVNEYKDRFIVGEIGSDKIDVLKQYQSAELLDVVFNFNFGSISSFSCQRIFNELQSMEKKMTSFPTLFFGSHDMPRMIDRLAGGSADRALALAALMLTAKGVPFIYYGEEIGMHNIIAQHFEEIADIQGRTQFKLTLAKGKDSAAALIEANNNNRDKSRGPMQWNSDAFGGFSTGKPWIKISTDYKHVNVRDLEKKENSILTIYKKLIKLRNSEKALQYGEYERLEYEKDQVLFTRSYAGDKVTVIINFGAEDQIILPVGGKILMGNTKLPSNSFLIYRH